jgi:Protein of unknown function (DUF3738)
VGKGVRLSGNLQLTGRMVTPSQLTKVLSDTVFNGENILDRPVLDRTGMIGSYDFTLSWKSDKDRADSDGPSIFSAVQEQLGLKLEAQKGAVEMLLTAQTNITELSDKWGSHPLPEFMDEPDPINGGYGCYPRFAPITSARLLCPDGGQGWHTRQQRA